MQFFKHFTSLSNEALITPFDTTMNLILLFCLIFVVIIFAFAKSKTQSENYKLFSMMIILIVILELSRQIWALISNQYLINEMLPFHLCGIQVMLMPLYLKTKNEKLATFIYLTALPGALAALIFNETVFYKYPLWHFQTIQTYLIHTLIMLVPLFGLIFLNIKPKAQHLKSSIIIIFVIAVFNTVVNFFTGGNYLFLVQAPVGTPIAWVASLTGWPGYIPVMMLLVIAIWVLMLLPFRESTSQKVNIGN